MPFRKLAITLVLLAFIVIFVAYAGRGMLQASSVYGDAERELQSRFGVPSADLAMPLFMPFSFSEGASKGDAAFFLCKKDNTCYHMKAAKDASGWRIISANQK